jgi:glucokinase
VEETLRRELERAVDPGAVIGQAGIDGSSRICVETVRTFCAVYGAQAGNLALTALAVGGVYVAGGIAPRFLSRIQEGGFMAAFHHKGRYSHLMDAIPVKLVLNPKASLIGAAQAARELAAGD